MSAASIRIKALIRWCTWATQRGRRVIAYDFELVVKTECSRRARERLRVIERVVPAPDEERTMFLPRCVDVSVDPIRRVRRNRIVQPVDKTVGYDQAGDFDIHVVIGSTIAGQK